MLYFPMEEKKKAKDPGERNLFLTPELEDALYHAFRNGRRNHRTTVYLKAIEPILCHFDPNAIHLKDAFSTDGETNCISYMEPVNRETDIKHCGLYMLYTTQDQICFHEEYDGIKYSSLAETIQCNGVKSGIQFILRMDAPFYTESACDIYQCATEGILIDRRTDRPDQIEYVFFGGTDAAHIFHDLFRYVTEYKHYVEMNSDGITDHATKRQIKAFNEKLSKLKHFDRCSFVEASDREDIFPYMTQKERNREMRYLGGLLKEHIEWRDDMVVLAREAANEYRQPCYELPQDISAEPFVCKWPGIVEADIRTDHKPVKMRHIGFGLYRVETKLMSDEIGSVDLCGISFLMKEIPDPPVNDDETCGWKWEILYAYSEDYAARDLKRILQQCIRKEGVDAEEEELTTKKMSALFPGEDLHGLTIYKEGVHMGEEGNLLSQLKWNVPQNTDASRIFLGKFIGERVMLPFHELFHEQIEGYYIHDPRETILYEKTERMPAHMDDIDLSDIPKASEVVGLFVGSEIDHYKDYICQYVFTQNIDRLDCFNLDVFGWAFLYDFRAGKIIKETRNSAEDLIWRCCGGKRSPIAWKEEPVGLIRGKEFDNASLHLELYPDRRKFDFTGRAYWENGELVMEFPCEKEEVGKVCRMPRELILSLSIDVEQRLRCGETIQSRQSLIDAKTSLKTISDKQIYHLYQKIMAGENYALPDHLDIAVP